MDKFVVTPDILISDLAEKSPEAALFLATEYGFHCVNCFASQFDTLEGGARIHGIMDEDFEEMMRLVQEIIDEEQKSTKKDNK